MRTSAIAAAEDAFTVLAASPAPLAFDGRGICGLPDRHLDLPELRCLLTATPRPRETTDAVWRRLAGQAREWGPAWVVAAVGLAAPGLTRVATRLAIGYPQLAEDIESEVVAGFLQELRTADLEAPRVWVRLLWAAWRAGVNARRAPDVLDLPDEVVVEASRPRVPYGHPDLVLGRAVAAGVLTAEEAELIGETRLGDVLIDQLADVRGVSPSALRMRRLRAERTLVDAMADGRLHDVRAAVPAGVTPAVVAHRNGVTLTGKGLSGAVRNLRVRSA